MGQSGGCVHGKYSNSTLFVHLCVCVSYTHIATHIYTSATSANARWKRW